MLAKRVIPCLDVHDGNVTPAREQKSLPTAIVHPFSFDP